MQTLTDHIVLAEHRARRARASVDSCGCAMGARFLAAVLAASSLWYGWNWHLSLVSFRGAALRILLWSVAASGAGKLIGILLYRRHSRGIKTRS